MIEPAPGPCQSFRPCDLPHLSVGPGGPHETCRSQSTRPEFQVERIACDRRTHSIFSSASQEVFRAIFFANVEENSGVDARRCGRLRRRCADVVDRQSCAPVREADPPSSFAGQRLQCQGRSPSRCIQTGIDCRSPAVRLTRSPHTGSPVIFERAGARVLERLPSRSPVSPTPKDCAGHVSC
jgi:hypothetical protein